jgi:hypothetical protein
MDWLFRKSEIGGRLLFHIGHLSRQGDTGKLQYSSERLSSSASLDYTEKVRMDLLVHSQLLWSSVTPKLPLKLSLPILSNIWLNSSECDWWKSYRDADDAHKLEQKNYHRPRECRTTQAFLLWWNMPRQHWSRMSHFSPCWQRFGSRPIKHSFWRRRLLYSLVMYQRVCASCQAPPDTVPKLCLDCLEKRCLQGGDDWWLPNESTMIWVMHAHSLS